MDTTDAQQALDLATAARRAAAPAVPAWQPPAMGLATAAGLSLLGASEELPEWSWVLFPAGTLLVLGAAWLVLAAGRRRGVVSANAGDRRWWRTTPSLAAIVVALAAGAAFGHAWFLVVAGVGLGASAWSRYAAAARG